MLDLEPAEKVYLKVRRYKLSLVFHSLFLIFFVILPPLLFAILKMEVNIPGNNTALFSGVYSLILLIAWMMFFSVWTNYYLDVLVITDRRIIDIKQNGFFRREVSTLSIDKVQDITITINGIIRTVLNFGSIQIQSAGTDEEFIIRDMPDPNKIKLMIYELQHRT